MTIFSSKGPQAWDDEYFDFNRIFSYQTISMPNSGPPLQLSYWFAVYSISSRKRCSEKKCNQYHVCFADQKNISDSMTWKILMQPIIFCGVANLVEETEMIFFLGKQSNTCYVQELNILWGFMLFYTNPPEKIWFFWRKLNYSIFNGF